MKTRFISLVIASAVLMLFVNSYLFAQNKPDTKETKNTKQTTQTENQKNIVTTQKQAAMTQQNDTKKSDHIVTNYKPTEHATMVKDNKNKESVNTQYHKKQNITTEKKETDDKTPVKGGNK